MSAIFDQLKHVTTGYAGIHPKKNRQTNVVNHMRQTVTRQQHQQGTGHAGPCICSPSRLRRPTQESQTNRNSPCAEKDNRANAPSLEKTNTKTPESSDHRHAACPHSTACMHRGNDYVLLSPRTCRQTHTADNTLHISLRDILPPSENTCRRDECM